MENTEMEEFVNAVRERSDIYEVVSRYVPLTMKSGRFWACCPFHEEKTPSFTVSPDKGIFYCFGCHEGGNVFKFISLMEHITYFEAVKLQAERLGIKMPSHKKSSVEIKTEQEKEALQRIAFLARDFYHNCLIKSKDGEAGRKYLAARGITENVIQEFSLGFAPDSWDALTKQVMAHGYSEKQLVASGLAVEKKSGGGVYDRLRGRVIIPISDSFGNAVAFGGRILVESENQPKYLNTPETEIFVKGKLLFGLDKSARAIISANTAIVVEGYMDAISLYSAGVKNVVASLGTAFTEEHAKILSRYARRIIFCYDSDEAGQRATMRAIPMMKNTGVEVFVLIVPDGKDPDEFIRKHGKAEFDKLLENANSIVDYQFQYKINHIDFSTLRGKFQVLNEMFPLCAEIKNTVIQREYFKKFSNVLLIDESLIWQEWQKFLKSANKNAVKNLPPPSKVSLIRQSGGDIVKTLWYEPELLNYVNALVPTENFLSVHLEIFNYIKKCYAEERTPNVLNSARELTSEANNEISRLLGKYEPHEMQMSAFQDSVKVMRRIALEKTCNQINTELEEFFKTGDWENYNEKLQSLTDVQNKLAELV